MKLFKKIKNIKRHKRNKRLRNLADSVFTEARYGDEMIIVSPRIYNIIYFRNSPVPSNIKEFGGIKNDFEIMTVPKELTDFYNINILKYDEWFGPLITQMHQEPSEECKKQLSNIPLSQFVHPEVFAPKLDTIKPILGE